MIAILVVNRQQIDAGSVKFTSAFGTDRTVDFERFRPVVGITINLATHPLEDGSSLSGAWQGYCSWTS